ncbi:MAG: hypothetical protein NC350_01015 [Corallococcus sp.]|nr:hypothetical protein [Corallococcus sp.]
MNKFITGSCLLGLSNAQDADYVILCDGDSKDYFVHKYENGADCFYKTKANLDSYMNFERPFTHRNAEHYVTTYQYDCNLVSQGFPYRYSVLEKRAQYVRLLRWIVQNKALNFDEQVLANIDDGTTLTKGLYHVAYLTFILANNSVTLTAEQKDAVQRIHDKQMPVSYLQLLRSQIDALAA